MNLRHRPVTVSAALAALVLAATPALAGSAGATEPLLPPDVTDGAQGDPGAATPDAEDAAPELAAEFDGQDSERRPRRRHRGQRPHRRPDHRRRHARVGCPGGFTLEVVDPAGEVLATQDVTAGDHGAFDTTVPGRVTRRRPAQGGATVLAVRAMDAAYEDYAAADAGAAAVVARRRRGPADREQLRLRRRLGEARRRRTPRAIIVTNPADSAVSDVSVTVGAPRGTSFTGARAPQAASPALRGPVTWTIPNVPAGSADEPAQTHLILEHAADSSTARSPPWCGATSSTRAVAPRQRQAGDRRQPRPRVIPQGEQYDTARYGDRPFPVVPVDYIDRKHQTDHTGELLRQDQLPRASRVDVQPVPGDVARPAVPRGHRAVGRHRHRRFRGDEPGFTALEPYGTCKGATFAGEPRGRTGTPLYTERIQDGFYQLPGKTEYYG